MAGASDGEARVGCACGGGLALTLLVAPMAVLLECWWLCMWGRGLSGRAAHGA